MNMKHLIFAALLVAMLFGAVSGASATELKVRGNLDVYGLWSANLYDFDSDVADGDNYSTTQRMRVYFDYVANENLKAVLGLELDNVWGDSSADWGTDGTGNIEVKYAYMDFNFPETEVNVKAGLQYVALPSVFGHPVFDDDASALVISAPINEMVGLTAGYTRGSDSSTSVDDDLFTDGNSSDDLDMAFVAVPVALEGFGATPYFGYVWLGGDHDFSGQQGLESKLDLSLAGDDDITIWFLGANAKLSFFDPLVLNADVIYGALDSDDLKSAGWYTALSASYTMDMLVATLFSTYATGLEDDEDDQTLLPVLAEDWKVTPNLGGLRAFSTTHDTFFTKSVGVGSDGTGLWTLGLILDKISFLDKLSHKVIIAYAQGTGDEGTSYFTEKDSCWELYFVNQFMIYENLAAINELGYFSGSSEVYKDAEGDDLDSSNFGTRGLSYKF